MSVRDYLPDKARQERIGMDEAIFCEFKTSLQIENICLEALDQNESRLLTRLNEEKHATLSNSVKSEINFDALSRTGWLGKPSKVKLKGDIGIVTAGTSDTGVAREAFRTLAYYGMISEEFYDVGVAGLWRIMEVEQQLRTKSVLIVVAGMDAALPSVVAGLVSAVVIAVPSSVGYGVSKGGQSALNSILSSCAPGLVTVNIDNGFGAACAAFRIVRQLSRT